MVVDNGSADGTVAMMQKEFRWVRLVENKKNVGFATANNMGLAQARGQYVMLLNSDTEVSPGAIDKVMGFMDTYPRVGAATCRLLLPDGAIDPACHRGFPTPWAALTYFVGLEKLFPRSRLFGQYHEGFKNMAEPHEIDSPSGAFYLVRRQVYETVGGLDEDYFMYGEDLDWSYRIKEKGWKIYYYPGAWVLHRKKQSGRANQDPVLRRVIERYFYESMRLFYQKHYADRYSFVTTAFIRSLL